MIEDKNHSSSKSKTNLKSNENQELLLNNIYTNKILKTKSDSSRTQNINPLEIEPEHFRPNKSNTNSINLKANEDDFFSLTSFPFTDKPEINSEFQFEIDHYRPNKSNTNSINLKANEDDFFSFGIFLFTNEKTPEELKNKFSILNELMQKTEQLAIDLINNMKNKENEENKIVKQYFHNNLKNINLNFCISFNNILCMYNTVEFSCFHLTDDKFNCIKNIKQFLEACHTQLNFYGKYYTHLKSYLRLKKGILLPTLISNEIINKINIEVEYIIQVLLRMSDLLEVVKYIYKINLHGKAFAYLGEELPTTDINKLSILIKVQKASNKQTNEVVDNWFKKKKNPSELIDRLFPKNGKK